MAQQRSQWWSMAKLRWAVVAVIIAGTIPVFDFILKGGDVIDRLMSWVTPQPSPVVRLTSEAESGDGTCVAMAFSGLPQDFSLGEIQFEITSSEGPFPIAGDMSATPLQRTVNLTLTPLEIQKGKSIRFRAAFEAEKRADVAYIDFCPMLAMVGTKANLEVRPEFFRPDGTKIESVSLVGEDGTPLKGAVPVVLAYPKNLVISIADPTIRKTET